MRLPCCEWVTSNRGVGQSAEGSSGDWKRCAESKTELEMSGVAHPGAWWWYVDDDGQQVV